MIGESGLEEALKENTKPIKNGTSLMLRLLPMG